MALALVLRARKVARWLVLPAAGLAAAVASGCFTAGQGTQPPLNSFYFPTGLAVSPDGKYLYAINSDFDLQWNGGTLQSYALGRVGKNPGIRQIATDLVQANHTQALSAGVKNEFKTYGVTFTANCSASAPGSLGNQLGVHVGANCAPPVDSTQFVQDYAIVGAFAEDLQVGYLPSQYCRDQSKATSCPLRLFAPMAGNSTVTWADIGTLGQPSSSLECGKDANSRCDGAHQTGDDPNSPGNTRNLTMPGEPYGLAISEDRSAIAVTSETDTKSSLLTTSSKYGCGTASSCPTMQFVVENLPSGGIAMAAVPHDKYAVRRCEDVNDSEPCIRPAFLETFVGAAEVDLLRYYDDDDSSTYRPFLARERAVSIPTSIGSDFRGLAIDPTSRYRCQASATTQEQLQICGSLPARVFIASRTPPSIVYADLGIYTAGGAYDPDALVFLGIIPLPAGPSKVYFAPVIIQDTAGAHYEPRIFVTLFDTGAVVVINPELVPPAVENYIYVGQNPYSLAFDPFGDIPAAAGNPNAPTMADIATHARVQPLSAASPGRYRFAYVGIFTQSYVQMIDLDDSAFTGTFEQVVFNLGEPSIPKGQANNNNGSFF
jgi:hypothetical protein